MKRTKGSRSEIGMLYQYGVTALLAAKLSENNRIADYVIYSSENSAGKFDDVVARIKLEDQDDWYLSLIQVKYKETKKLNVSDNLMKSRRIERFLSDYIQCFNEILDNEELTCRQDIPNENIRFAIFCDKGIQMPVFLRQDCTFQLKLSSYCDQEESNEVNNFVLPFNNRYWKFVCEDLENSQEHQLFFDRCCLFLEQLNYNKLIKEIEKICGISSGKEIINYVKDYFNDDYLYKQGLWKEVFEIELERIRFFDAIPPLIALDDLAEDGRIDIWNNITLEHDITLINGVQDFIVESTLYSCLVHKLNALLRIDVDWKTYIDKRKVVDKEIVKRFIAYSKTKKLRYWIDPPPTLQLLLVELWKCGDLPLILKTDVKLDKMERCTHLKRSYIIVNDLSEDEVSKVSNLKIFNCLSSITQIDLQELMLQNTWISLQGREPVTLKDLLMDDRELMSTFTSSDLLRTMRKRIPYLIEDYFKGSNYLLFIVEDEKCMEISERIEPYAIGHNITVSYPSNRLKECLKTIRKHADIYENYTICCLQRIDGNLKLVEGDLHILRHLFVDQYGDAIFIKNEDELFPIIGHTINLNELQYIRRRLRRATLPRAFFNYPTTKICFLSGDLDSIQQEFEISQLKDISTDQRTYFVKIEAKEEREYYWRQLSQLGHPIFDIYVNGGRLDLLRFCHCKDLARHISYDGEGEYTEEKFLNEIRSGSEEIAVITGDAGIGKTSLLKWVCNNYNSTEDYIIFYDLINLQIDLTKSEYRKTDPVDFILEKICKCVPKKYITFVSTLIKRKNRLLWVLDSFDEIRLACEEQVLNFIRSILQNSGAQIIIATRTENCHVLLDQLPIRLIKIEPLQEKERSTYWALNEDLLGNVSSELATNPLYLNFLKIISINKEQLLNITKFTLYQKVIHMKIKRCLHTTYRIVHDSEIERTVGQFERLALMAMFGKATIERELYWTIDKEVSDMSKFGIITGFDENTYPIFYHRSFVEFLVAQWLAKAHLINIYKHTARCIYKRIFDENKLHILNILTEDVELHKTILQADLFKMEDITKQEDPERWNVVDKLGRTALHAAVINCRSVNRLTAAYQMLELVVKSMLKVGCPMDKSDTIMDWNWSEYVQEEIFEFACVFQKMELIKIYLRLHRRKVEIHNYPTTVFPTKYFNMLCRTAIKFSSIDMIAHLVYLQNYDNKVFGSLYRMCLGLCPAAECSLWTEMEGSHRFEGQLTPLHVACIYGSLTMIEHLIKLDVVDVNAIDSFTCTPLYYCTLRSSPLRKSENENNRDIEAINSILEAGAIVNPGILPTSEMSPLSLAVQIGNVEVIKMLLESGADICRRSAGEDTPLHLAARAGDANVVECLLNYRAPLFWENERGESAIDIAIKQNHKEVIDLLRTRRDTAINDIQEDIDVDTIRNRDVGFGGTPLHDAVCSDDLNLINVLLNNGGDVNVQNGNGFTLLHAALNHNNDRIINFLLSKGAAVDLQDKFGFTPLSIAIGNANHPITEAILENGANPDIANMFSVTPLYRAVEDRNITGIKMLLGKGANINVQRVDGITPLYAAARNGDVDIAALLLDNGADTEVPDEYDATPLHISILERHKEMSELLLGRGANPNIPSKEGHASLYLATFREDLDTVRLLLEKGARVNDRDTDGVTPLHVAVKFGNENIFKLLLENGANVNAKTVQGESVLFLATESDRETDIIRLLLEANVDIDREGGANALGLAIVKGDITVLKLLLTGGVLGGVNAWDEYGHTPLHLAAETGRAAIVDYLLEQGAHLNAKTLMGYTPLHHAVRDKQEHIVGLLIDKGADINTESNMCSTALILAIDARNVNIVKLLLQENGVHVSYEAAIETLKFAVCMGDVVAINLLLNKNVQLQNVHSEYTYTLLYVAVIKRDADIMDILLQNLTITDEIKSSIEALNNHIQLTRLLLDLGANIDVLIAGNTSLHLKVAEGDEDFVKLLIEKGADVNLRTEQGRNPLEIAVNSEHTNIVRVLLEGGADVNAPTSKGDNIIISAARRRNVNLVELLLNNGTSMILDDQSGNTLLHECARYSNICILKLLLDRQIDLNIQDNVGNTALHIGILERNLDVVALLSSRNADAYITNYNGRSPFHLAICKNCGSSGRSFIGDRTNDGDDDDASHQVEMNDDNVEVIWSLLVNMKAIDLNNDDVVETYYWAAEQGRSQIVKLFLHNGMNINIQDQYGYTAFHLAVNNNKKDTVEMLAEEGANLHLTNNSGATPLDSARSRGYENIVEIIIGLGVEIA